MLKSPIVKIVSKQIEDSILPARAIAYRRDGSRLEAGDKYLRSAIVTLYALITGERLLPSIIKRKLKESHARVFKQILEVL